MQFKCPICWKPEDGEYPCAFLHDGDLCSRTTNQKSCIRLHYEKYLRALEVVSVPCPRCGYPVGGSDKE